MRVINKLLKSIPCVKINIFVVKTKVLIFENKTSFSLNIRKTCSIIFTNIANYLVAHQNLGE